MASNNARARPRIRLLGRNISGRRKGVGRHAEQSLLPASAQTKVVQFVARHVRAVDTPGWGRHFLAGRSPPRARRCCGPKVTLREFRRAGFFISGRGREPQRLVSTQKYRISSHFLRLTFGKERVKTR